MIMFTWKKASSFAISCMLIVLLAACGGGNNEKTVDTAQNSGSVKPAETVKPTESAKPKEPFALSVYAAAMTQEEFDKRYGEALKKKFPHITFTFLTNTPGNKIEEMVPRGEIPDLIKTDLPTFKVRYLDLGLGEDLNPYIAKYKYDLTRFNISFIQELKDYAGDGKLYGLPMPAYLPSVLYYNKTLFDKFGIAYPKDGMTFDEVYELAKKMTRTEAGTTYRGFSANLNSVLRENPFSLPVLDPTADKLAVPEKWQQLFTNLKRFYEIPGNTFNKTLADEANAFAGGNVAMAINQFSTLLKMPDTFEWNMVAVPTLEGAPKRTIQRGPAYWTIAKTSKYKDEAFEVMMAMLSDEMQLNDSKQGLPPTVNKKEIIDALGTEHPVFKTKNLKAISFYPPTDPTPRRSGSVFDLDPILQFTPLSNNFIEYVLGKVDVNTALRTTEEQVLKKLAEEKAKVKK